MKNLIYTFVIALIFTGCAKQSTDDGEQAYNYARDGMIVNVERALIKAIDKNGCNKSELPWLKDLLTKAEEDRTTMKYKGNYIGIVSLYKYKDKNLIYIDFFLERGGGAYILRDCNGDPFFIPRSDAGYVPNEAMKKKNIIYASAFQ